MAGVDGQLMKGKSIGHSVIPNVSFAGHFQFSINDFQFSSEDLASHKMTSMLAEVLVVVKDLSRDVQFIKRELAEGNMTPGGSRGPATTTFMFPFQLPIASEQDFNEAESLLMDQSVRQKMVNYLTD